MEKQADLRKWFAEDWRDISRKNPDGSHPECGRDEAKLGKKGYPKCRPKAKAAQMTKKEKSYAVRAKRSKRQGVGGKPTMVPTEKPEKQTKTAMNLFDHFEAGLEKIANQSGYESVPARMRGFVAEDIARSELRNLTGRANYHDTMHGRAMKKQESSMQKSENPGLLSMIRHLGTDKARAHHQVRAELAAEKAKYHGTERDRLEQDFVTGLDDIQPILAARGTENYNRVGEEYLKRKFG